MKTTTLLGLAALLSPSFASPSPPSSAAILARDTQLRAFEERYLNSMEYNLPNSTIKLIGFKKILMTPSELADLERNIAALPTEWDDIKTAYYDPVERAMRVYFPVQRALVHHQGKLVEATDMGELHHGKVDGDCAVVGRYQTEQVRGVPANRVEGGIIHLREPSKVLRRDGEGGNVHVYDFGWRRGTHHHEHHHEEGVEKRKEGEGGSCYQNHGNKVCSIVYKIDQGRCTRPKGTIKECIDYNGWPFTSCNNHSDKKAFPLSDCFVAVAQGHCWNEIDGAL